MVVGAGVVLGEPILGWERFVALTGANTDLRILGGAVALVGVCTLIIGDLDDNELPPQTGSSSSANGRESIHNNES